MGESSGALRAGAFAMAAPQHIERLVLTALTYTGKGSPTLGKRAEQLAYYHTHNRRPRDRAMIESIFTRDKPGTTDPAVAPALANAELVYGDSVPTGTYLDMTAHLPVVDPTKIAAPVASARRIRRHRDEGGSVGFLPPVAERRPPVRHHRECGACAWHLPQPRGVLAYGAGVFLDAARAVDRVKWPMPVGRMVACWSDCI